jgi:hypothetical protein
MQTSDPRVQVTSIGRDQWKLAVQLDGDWQFTSALYRSKDEALADVGATVTEYLPDYVVTFNPRPVVGPGCLKGLRRMTLADARSLRADAIRDGRIVHAGTLATV